jgi:hypothetical protein
MTMMTKIMSFLRKTFNESEEEMANSKSKSKSYYSKSKLVDIRTINYRFSVKSKSDQHYVDLKGVIAEHNASQRELEDLGITPHYLVVRGRGRGSHIEQKLTGRIVHKCSIPDHMADYFDVYVARDSEKLKRAVLRMAKSTTAKNSTKTLASLVTNRTLSTLKVA